jgi:predicted RNA binding protein with dsRBD fold (UPF0201 family)
MKLAAAITLAMLTAPAAADTLANVVERAKLDVQPAGKAFRQITIDNALGDVIVEGYDGKSIVIESNKQAADVEGLDRLRISLVPNPDGTVRITTTADRDRENKPMKRGAVRIDLKVRAPRDVRIEASASAGTLAISNMDNGGDLDTASGQIRVKNVAGELSTHSVSGPTSIVQVFGSVDSQTLSSDLDFDSISGERLVASANHGKIAGRRVRSREVQLTTNDGKIVFEGEASLRGRVVVASLKGDVDVRLRRQGIAMVIRAQGVKVSLGANANAQAQEPASDGWVESKIGQATKGTIPAFVEMRSRHGNVKFVALETD